MLKIAIVSLLILSSIFWGLFPVSENSPHNYIAKYLGYNEDVHYMIYVLLGTFFYFLSAFLCQQNDIQAYWK